jgi:sec-independent protein translocase protein TatB
MFGLGPTELIVILVLGVLLLGPQRIPEAAASLGKAIRSFRKATRELRDQIDIEDEVRRPLEDLRAALRDEPPLIAPPPPVRSTTPPLVSPPAEQIHSSSDVDGHDAPVDPAAAALAAAAGPAPGQVPADAPVNAPAFGHARVPVYTDPTATNAVAPPSPAPAAVAPVAAAAAPAADAPIATAKEPPEAPK